MLSGCGEVMVGRAPGTDAMLSERGETMIG
jgi:hypothetical protein